MLTNTHSYLKYKETEGLAADNATKNALGPHCKAWQENNRKSTLNAIKKNNINNMGLSFQVIAKNYDDNLIKCI